MPPVDSAVQLIEAAPWLGEGLAIEDREAARRTVLVPRIDAGVGPWEWIGPRPAVGLLILSGRVARSLRVEGASEHGIEILGEGDLLRPWTYRGESSSLPATEGFTVLTRLEMAVLDLAYVRATLRWPRISVNLLDSVIERARSVSYFLTARQVPRLEARILVVLWHLADRWGHVSSEGVVLDLPKLTHEMIAHMVAARRPSVTTGIRHLRDLGLVDVQSRGRWLLRGDPSTALAALDSRPGLGPAATTDGLPAGASREVVSRLTEGPPEV